MRRMLHNMMTHNRYNRKDIRKYVFALSDHICRRLHA